MSYRIFIQPQSMLAVQKWFADEYGGPASWWSIISDGIGFLKPKNATLFIASSRIKEAVHFKMACADHLVRKRRRKDGGSCTEAIL